MKTRSVKFRLVTIFLFVLFLLLVLGMFGIDRLKGFNKVSLEIRNQWLQNTRILGELDNITSDFRILESSHILSLNKKYQKNVDKEILSLESHINKSISNYRQIRHEDDEQKMFEGFVERWEQYRQVAQQVQELSSNNQKNAATALFQNESSTAYQIAIQQLCRLKELNVAKATEATRRAEATYFEALTLNVISMLLSGVIVIIVLLNIKKSISDPLIELANCMKRLAQNETNMSITGTDRNDEIGEMARTVVVFRKNSVELAQTQRTLALQAELLEKMLADERYLASLQRNFVTMASHEFRTPLTIIDCHAQRLIKMKDRIEVQDMEQRVKKIRSAAIKMAKLIENLLSSSRIYDNDSEIGMKKMQVNITSILNEVCQSQKEITPMADIRQNFADQTLMVIGDSDLLNQVFSNLLANAIKYSSDERSISISLEKESDRVKICVKDQGIGIPDKDIEHVFERYYRGSNVTGVAGTGIGLHLVKVFVELHEGRCLVESKEGEGTTFIVYLPLSS